MSDADAAPVAHAPPGKLLATLEQLLTLPATEVKATLDQASQILVEVLRAEKVDTFVYDPASATLVALGASATALAVRQRSIGLDRLPLANGGRAAAVYQTGTSYHTGRTDQDPDELAGVKQGLGVRSTLMVPLEVASQCRGVLSVQSRQPDRFGEEDLRFLEAVAGWVGMIMHRAELVEQIAREAVECTRRVVADELITTLAHDLRGPLTPLGGRIGLLRNRAVDDGRAHDVADADAAMRVVERLRRMIQNMLDAGRLEHGIFALSRQVVDLAGLASATAEMLQNPGVAIDVRAAEAVVVEADPERLRQALENLLTNALRHSPGGVPVVLEVSSEARADGGWAVVTVHDAGPGIPPHVLPHLFTRFGRGDESQGLGLGLYLARGIAEAHGGTLVAESTPGKGASFQLSLPLTTAPETPPGNAAV